ncbi:MAG: amidase [Verrucomicrobiales bacterium]|nr:amidase [Verrucomicrobiales bacterium]
MSTTRRRFLAATLASATAPLAASASASGDTSRARAGSPPRPRSRFRSDVEDEHEFTLDALRRGMESGRWTAARLVRYYRERGERLDAAGPQLNSVVEWNPDADQIARDLDRERRHQGARGPLHGIPILLKDNLDTADRLATTAGSLALAGVRARADAGVVRQLRAAGAVILGKTNLSEWANIRSPRSTSGWSSRGGLTRNPYALDRNTSGSSSGSAVAVAANLSAAAVGTETDGSIVSPSSVNGIVGLKPTVGLLSGSGIIPIAHSQDTAGPMGRTVRDVALLLEGMVDGSAGVIRGRPERGYAAALDGASLAGVRLGVVRNAHGFDRDPVIEQALAVLRSEGATLVDPVELPNGGEVGGTEFQILMWELKADLDAYLSHLGPESPVHSLADVIEFNQTHRQRVMPYFGQEHLIFAAAKGPLTEPAYLTALATAKRLARDEGLDAALRRHQVEALVAPTGGPAWKTDLVYGDEGAGALASSSTFPAVAGYPNVTVPAGFVHGLPAGISFFGGAWQEATLLRLAAAFERASQVRRAPQFLATAG